MTGEQRQQRDELAALVEGTGRRLRVVPDVEGCPIVPGVRGQVEVIAYPGGALALAVYTRSSRCFRELLAVPGCRRLQVGDSEFRVLAPWSAEALGRLAGIIRARTRRSSTVPAAFLDAGRAVLERHRASVQARNPGPGAAQPAGDDAEAVREPSAQESTASRAAA